MSLRIKNGKSEKIEVMIQDDQGYYVTGLTDVLLSIRRLADNFYLDFGDSLDAKASGWTARTIALTEYVPASPITGTGDADGSTGTISNMPSTVGFQAGDYVTVSAGFEYTNRAYKILSVTADSITIDIASISAQLGITVTAWYAPGRYQYVFDSSDQPNDQVYVACVKSTSIGYACSEQEIHIGEWVDDLTLIKGALGFNCVLDDVVHDGDLKTTDINMYIYNTPANAAAHVIGGGGGTGLLKKITGTAIVVDKMTTFFSRIES